MKKTPARRPPARSRRVDQELEGADAIVRTSSAIRIAAASTRPCTAAAGAARRDSTSF